MFFAYVIVICGLATVFAEQSLYEKEFYDHMLKYKVQVKDGKDFVYRLNIFSKLYDEIQAHNADTSKTYKKGLNQFSHLTLTEFRDAVKIGGTRIPNFVANKQGQHTHEEPAEGYLLPDSVDWRSKGAVTAVKDQGQCGSCWSFSTTGALEGAYFIKYNDLQVFSEQQLVSCDTIDSGCNGGWMDNTFMWVKGNGGITTEDAYPYTSGTTMVSGTCGTSGYTNNANVAPQSYTDVTSSVTALMSAVTQQPVSIAIEADEVSFQTYNSGVLTASCGQNLDHGVLVVGYGTEDGTPYWLVKNSWGPTWGDEGYIKIERSDANLCGVLSAPSYPNL